MKNDNIQEGFALIFPQNYTRYYTIFISSGAYSCFCFNSRVSHIICVSATLTFTVHLYSHFFPKTVVHFLEALAQFRAAMTEAWVSLVLRASGLYQGFRVPHGNISHSISGPLDSQSLGFSTERFLQLCPQVPSRHASPVPPLTTVISQNRMRSLHRPRRGKKPHIIKLQVFQLNILLCLLTVMTQMHRQTATRLPAVNACLKERDECRGFLHRHFFGCTHVTADCSFLSAEWLSSLGECLLM